MATIAMAAEDTKPMKEEPQTFNGAWNHPNPVMKKMARGYLKRNSTS